MNDMMRILTEATLNDYQLTLPARIHRHMQGAEVFSELFLITYWDRCLRYVPLRNWEFYREYLTGANDYPVFKFREVIEAKKTSTRIKLNIKVRTNLPKLMAKISGIAPDMEVYVSWNNYWLEIGTIDGESETVAEHIRSSST